MGVKYDKLNGNDVANFRKILAKASLNDLEILEHTLTIEMNQASTAVREGVEKRTG